MIPMKTTLLVLLSLLSALSDIALADMNGMDMSMDGAMSLASGNMLSYLHFTSGDVVWFQGWVPSSGGAMVGACIGLFLLALFDRWLAACRGLMELQWRKQAAIDVANRVNTKPTGPPLDNRAFSSSTSISKEPVSKTSNSSDDGDLRVSSLRLRTLMPFVPAYDIPRGLVQAAQSALEFTFMLVVMTFQVAFIISLVVGLGVGETLFGRYNVYAHIY